MLPFVKLYSTRKKEILKFVNQLHDNTINYSADKITEQTLECKFSYKNPVEITNIIGVFIENNHKFHINMWLCLDQDFLINITEHNADAIIRYIYERFPY